MVEKKCSKCKQTKPVEQFHNCAKTPDRLAKRCRTCVLETLYSSKHKGATRVKPQNCELCRRKKPLCYDHDHETKKFRGWICAGCNSAIGKLGDNIEGVRRALSYLEQNTDAQESTSWSSQWTIYASPPHAGNYLVSAMTLENGLPFRYTREAYWNGGGWPLEHGVIIEAWQHMPPYTTRVYSVIP